MKAWQQLHNSFVKRQRIEIVGSQLEVSLFENFVFDVKWTPTLAKQSILGSLEPVAMIL